jgi:hypothetical protein
MVLVRAFLREVLSVRAFPGAQPLRFMRVDVPFLVRLFGFAPVTIA